jgi:hypothetical protein
MNSTALPIRKPKTITRFLLSYVNRDGIRTIFGANQGRNFFDTEGAAQKHMRAVLLNNAADKLTSTFGPLVIESLRVTPAECYENGDAFGIYFGDLVPVQLKSKGNAWFIWNGEKGKNEPKAFPDLISCARECDRRNGFV